MSLFVPARREQMRARIALQGPAGSGKTYTAMVLARALSAGTAGFGIIDTERRALEYADRFDFVRHAPAVADPEQLPGHIAEAAAAGLGALIVDSYSLYWSGTGGALDRVDRTADKRRGWTEYRPVENAVRDALLTYPGHLIVTMRTKTEYVTEQNERGKTVTRRVGLKADQRDGVDYEFSIVGELDTEHTLTFTKTTCPALVDRSFNRPGQDLVDTLQDWLGQGDPVADVNQLRAQALAESSTVDVLRALFDDARRRHLLGAPVLDEHNRLTTLGELIRRLGAERGTAPAQAAA